MSRRYNRIRGCGERGAVLLVAIVVLTVLLFLGATLIERAQTEVYRTAVENRSAQSFHLAEAGVHKAMYELSRSSGWDTYDGEQGVSVPPGRFDVTVWPPASMRAAASEVRVTGRGYLPGPNGTKRLSRRVEVVYARNTLWPFGYALAASHLVELGDARVDSYRSVDGPYGGTNVLSNATIAVNATSYASGTSGIGIGANGVLYGSALVGAGTSDPTQAVSVAGTLNGSLGTLDAPLPMDTVTVPATATNLGAVSLSGNQTLTLTSGAYYASSLSITGSTASLIVQGEVDLYIGGDLDVGGNGSVNKDSGKPSNLRIYGTATCTSVKIRGSSTFYGLVYAPNAAISAQGSTESGEIYGALVGKSVTLGGNQTKFHYDESLGGRGRYAYNACSWQQL